MPNWRRIARWLTVAGVFSVNVFPVAQTQWHETDQKRWISLQQIKTQSIDPEKNAEATVAHAVFAQLLRAWNSPRLAPTLHVIDAGSEVWAAPQDEGSVLITRAALAVTLNAPSATARLSFVLGHGLRHQPSNYLCRQRYFHLAEKPSTPGQKKIYSDEMKRLNAQRIVAKYGVPDRVIVGDELIYVTYV